MGDVKPDIKAPPAGEQPQHLQIKIRSQEGEQIEFKVKPTTKFEKVSRPAPAPLALTTATPCLIQTCDKQLRRRHDRVRGSRA